MIRKLLAAIVLAALAAGGAWLWWARTRPPPPPPSERLLFERKIPGWITSRAREDLHAIELSIAKDLAQPWPALVQALDGIDQAWPDVPKTKAAVAALNGAAAQAGLRYWVDVVVWRKLPYLLTYEVLGRTRWRLGAAEKELLRVRRLDHVNIEMGYLGHAGGDLPVVLVDRLEPAVLESLQKAFAQEPEGNAVNRAAIAAWRRTLEARLGAPALAKAAALVARRERLYETMRGHLKDGAVVVLRPERMIWGEDFFDSLMPATDYKRRGGPLLLAADVRELRRADEALRDGEERRALDAALELEAAATEAHEARHALDPEPLPIPEPLLLAAGEDDPEFARAAERELRAYLGQLHDAASPPCITLARLAVQTGGHRARETPHHFAGMILLETLGSGPEGLPALLEELCGLPEDEVRKRASLVFKTLYGKPLEAASRPVP